jgi:hypothetical protein
VGNGFAVEIEDRGLGLTGERLTEINNRLANPPEFDLSDTDQLGLFVAGRLAARHGIKISVRTNAYGGSTAIVLIPRALVIPEQTYTASPAAVRTGDSAIGLTRRRADSRAEALFERLVPPPPAAPGPAAVRDAGDTTQPPSLPAGGYPAGGPNTAQASPAAALPVGASPPAQPAPPGPDGDELALPRRVRQANLAPQLRDSIPPAPTAGEPTADRSPEQTRALMAAMQRGWERGRSDIGPSNPGDASGDDTLTGTVADWHEGR